MPLIALALVLDLVGLGHPAWVACGWTLDAAGPCPHGGAPQRCRHPASHHGHRGYLAFIGAMLWLALWHGRARLLGLVPAVAAAISLALLAPPDVLITGDGRHVGIVEDGTLVMLREAPTTFTRQAMMHRRAWPGRPSRWTCGRTPPATPISAVCGAARGSRVDLLIARGKALAKPADMAAACAGWIS
jgi:competence protein ComEC